MKEKAFENLYKKFEKKETDLYVLQGERYFSRFILIRSQGKEHLIELIKETTGKSVDKGRLDSLYKKLFLLDISEEEIINYINKKYPEVRDSRKNQEKHLPKIIEEFGEVRCGVRNDNLNDTAKDLVRDKSITSKDLLEEKVDDLLKNTIKGYILWQYYNQVTNDLIEHIFNDHDKVIPTLRKIKYVDFLVKIGDQIIPFDLKITHISDDYYDLYGKGLTRSTEDSDDDYGIGDGQSEIEKIKVFYKSIKKERELPNYGGLKKIEIINILNLVDDETKDFIEQVRVERSEIVEKLGDKLRSVEWWNYKYQGERLFKNNNRFFVFLAYKNSFEDARPLKGDLISIKNKVVDKLNSLSQDDMGFHKIKYYYQKDKGLEGGYEVISTSVLVTD